MFIGTDYFELSERPLINLRKSAVGLGDRLPTETIFLKLSLGIERTKGLTSSRGLAAIFHLQHVNRKAAE